MKEIREGREEGCCPLENVCAYASRGILPPRAGRAKGGWRMVRTVRAAKGHPRDIRSIRGRREKWAVDYLWRRCMRLEIEISDMRRRLNWRRFTASDAEHRIMFGGAEPRLCDCDRDDHGGQ